MYLYVIIDCINKDENIHRYAVRGEKKKERKSEIKKEWNKEIVYAERDIRSKRGKEREIRSKREKKRSIRSKEGKERERSSKEGKEREKGGMLCKLLFFVRDPKLWYSVRDLSSTREEEKKNGYQYREQKSCLSTQTFGLAEIINEKKKILIQYMSFRF